MSDWLAYNKPFCAKTYSYTEVNDFINKDREYTVLEKDFGELDSVYKKARSNCVYISTNLAITSLNYEFVRRIRKVYPDVLLSPNFYEEDCRLQEYTECWQKVEELSDQHSTMKRSLAMKNDKLAMRFKELISKNTFVGEGLCKVGTLFKCGGKEYLVGHGSVFELTHADIVTEYTSIYP